MTEQNEFKACGMTMTTMTLGYGVLLIVWGLALFLISGHKTAAMPAVIGLPILLAGVLALKVPSKRKIWMHIAVILGLLNFVVGVYMIMKASGSDGGLFENQRKAASFIMLATTGLLFTVSCVRSFIWARKNPPAA
jgi:uncharacterized membrane protein HdeD (DUF308 family)